ncbi:MAG: hypothetical protein ACRDM1_15800, partial [Gaiellaceae bacterium]
VLVGCVPALAACGGSGRAQPRFVVGAVDDAAKWAPDPGRQMRLATDSGFRAVDLSAVWKQGSAAAADLPPLRRAVRAAVAGGVQPLLSVYQMSSSTPLDAPTRTAFASYAAGLARALPDVHEVIVGNEPNLNLFWLPQFGPTGDDAAAPAYEKLLAQTYDALKAVDSGLTVVGGALAPHGGDDPTAARATHSPTRFIADLGAAYRASGRTKPLMDAFSIHPYGESSRVPPTLTHPRTTSIGIADYGKLVSLLGHAFDGTGQAGSKLPIVYGEYGVETTIPAAKAHLYTGREVVRTVDEQTQARYYVKAIELAACQPNVRMLLLFHVSDEPRLEGLQSGVRYADGSPKSSRQAVRSAAGQGCAHR